MRLKLTAPWTLGSSFPQMAEGTTFGLVPDAAVAVLMDELIATKNRKKYKRSMTLPTGQKVNVRWDGEAFYYRDQSGGKVLLMPPSVRS